MQPPYSPDLAPSDYHLFRSLQNSLNGVKLASKEACENQLVQFFARKSQSSTVTELWFYQKTGKRSSIKTVYILLISV